MGGLPEGIVLSTKADRDLKTGEFTGEQIRRSVERSLELLSLDRLQLVYLHDPEHETYERIMAPGGPAETLMDLKDGGVIGHVGVAGGPIDLMARYVRTGLFEAVITHNRTRSSTGAQNRCSSTARAHGVAVLNAAPTVAASSPKAPTPTPATSTARPRPRRSRGSRPSSGRAWSTACRWPPPHCSSRCGAPTSSPPSSVSAAREVEQT